MRFTFAALLATLATTCFAHKVSTLAFPPMAPVSPGSKIVVQVVRGVSLFSPGFGSWFTKPHWHWFYRTLWHRPLSFVLRLGHAPQQIQFAFLLARLWEPFSLRGPSIRNSHDAFNRASSAEFHGHYSLDVRTGPRRAFHIPPCFNWGKWFW